MLNLDELLNRKYTLQRDILDSWTELQAKQKAHSNLLAELSDINQLIKENSEPSLFNQLFEIN